MVQTKNIEAHPISAHAIEHNQKFDNGFSYKSVNHAQNDCSPHKFTNCSSEGVIKTYKIWSSPEI